MALIGVVIIEEGPSRKSPGGHAAPRERRDLMVRFLFWNYRYDGPDREELLARFIRAEAVDVAVLAESSVDRAGLG
jgi:hypothetical protein